MDRCFQALLMFSTAVLSWLLMLVLHESGHTMAGWLTGRGSPGCISRCWASRTPNSPSIRIRCWWRGAGPCGEAFCRWRFSRPPAASPPNAASTSSPGSPASASSPTARTYWAARSSAAARTTVASSFGLPARWQLFAFAVPAVAAGLTLWNGLGPYFGLGPSRGKVNRTVAIAVTLALIIVVCAEALIANH